MASSNENVSMALFCDFENVALGVRDANYDKFDIKPVLERLLLKGSIVVKKAYCDWDRYKSFKASMHEANFELIEIPHVRQSGKNSADIRMVVDALDLCYTKSHVDTFVIISGDSDFSPLVSKLRENAKKVIGVGVKQSTSDLLVANCDEFIFYDDLVRESRRARRDASPDARQQTKRTPEEERARREEMEKRRNQAVEIAINTFEALVLERGDSGKIWASVLKEAIKRRKPDFSESYYGFRTFGNLIEECKARGLLEFGRDEKSGAYVYRGSGVPVAVSAEPHGDGAAEAQAGEQPAAQQDARPESRRSRNRGRTAAERFAERQAERLARQQASAGQGATTDVGAEAPAAEAAPAPVAFAPAIGEETPVVLEAAVDLPADASAAPAKKKSGAKPPARKLKAEAKAKAESGANEAAPAAKGGKKGKGKAAAAVEQVAVAVEAAAAAAGEPAPDLAPVADAAPATVATPAQDAALASDADSAEAAPGKAGKSGKAKPARKPASRTPRPRAPKKAAAEE